MLAFSLSSVLLCWLYYIDMKNLLGLRKMMPHQNLVNEGGYFDCIMVVIFHSYFPFAVYNQGFLYFLLPLEI